jgi:hypothetical protein
MEGSTISDIGRVRSQIRAAELAAMNELGDLIVAGIREDISEPYPPSSAPGENPHSRTGNLLQGVAHQTEAFEGGVRIVIYVNRAGGDPLVPVYLNQGTSRMRARPFMSTSFAEWSEKIGTVLPDLMSTHLAFVAVNNG